MGTCFCCSCTWGSIGIVCIVALDAIESTAPASVKLLSRIKKRLECRANSLTLWYPYYRSWSWPDRTRDVAILDWLLHDSLYAQCFSLAHFRRIEAQPSFEDRTHQNQRDPHLLLKQTSNLCCNHILLVSNLLKKKLTQTPGICHPWLARTERCCRLLSQKLQGRESH